MAVDIRYNDDGNSYFIDEIVATAVSVHIERMGDGCWFIGVEDADKTYHQFWLGTGSGRGKVVIRHQETTPAALKEAGE